MFANRHAGGACLDLPCGFRCDDVIVVVVIDGLNDQLACSGVRVPRTKYRQLFMRPARECRAQPCYQSQPLLSAVMSRIYQTIHGSRPRTNS